MRTFTFVALLLTLFQCYGKTQIGLQKHQASKNRKHDLLSQTESNVSKLPLVASSPASNDVYKGVACIIGGFLAHLTYGSLYCWGNFLSYSPPQLRFFDGQEHPNQPDALQVMPITLLAQCLTMPLGPLLVKRLGPQKTQLIGSVLVALGVYLASFTKTLRDFLAFYSVLFGAGVGLAYTAPMTAAWNYMPDKKGLVSGVILTGFGGGGFIFNLIGTKLVNPKNLEALLGKFPEEVYSNFPNMLRKLASLYLTFSLVGSLLIIEKKDIKLVSAPTVNQSGGKGGSSATALSGPSGVGVIQALQTKQFWMLWFMVITSASAGLNVASVYKQFASTSPNLTGDSFQSLVGGLGALFNALGRLFWGNLSDTIGFKKSFIILTVMQSALHFLFPKSTVSKQAFAAVTCLCYFCLAGNFALMPPAVQRLFGSRNGTLIYGLLYSAFATAAVGGMQVAKALNVALGWEKSFQSLAAVSLIATLITSFVFPISSYTESTI